MRVQADITTALLDIQRDATYGIGGEHVPLAGALASLNLASVRIALFSNHSAVVPLDRSLDALRLAAALSLDAYLCLHCSDAWADPSHQSIPTDWNFRDRNGVRATFAAYLENILRRAAATGARIRYIQLGNEVTRGFLWPFGGDWNDFADLYAAGAALMRRHLPKARLVLHTDLGGSGERAIHWYAEAERRRLPFDAIGLSYYPVWHGDLDSLQATLEGLARRFGRPILIAETGYMNTAEKTSAWFGDWTARGIPYAEAGQGAFLEELACVIDAADERVCRDVFWWGAFAHLSPDHFPVSWFDRHGRALAVVARLGGKRLHD
jgi:arabinogalactan endo-1,4-beta-galactosidase